MNFCFDLIPGMCLGIETHYEAGIYLVLNLLIVRLMWVSDEVAEELESDD